MLRLPVTGTLAVRLRVPGSPSQGVLNGNGCPLSGVGTGLPRRGPTVFFVSSPSLAAEGVLQLQHAISDVGEVMEFQFRHLLSASFQSP